MVPLFSRYIVLNLEAENCTDLIKSYMRMSLSLSSFSNELRIDLNIHFLLTKLFNFLDVDGNIHPFGLLDYSDYWTWNLEVRGGSICLVFVNQVVTRYTVATFYNNVPRDSPYGVFPSKVPVKILPGNRGPMGLITIDVLTLTVH